MLKLSSQRSFVDLSLLISCLFFKNSELVASTTVTNVNFTIVPSGGIFDPNATSLDITSGVDSYTGNSLGYGADSLTISGGNFSLYQDIIGQWAGTVSITGGSFYLYQSNIAERCQSVYISPSPIFTIVNGFIASNCGSVTLQGGTFHNTGDYFLVGGTCGSNSLLNSGPISILQTNIINDTNSGFMNNIFESVTMEDSTFFNGTNCNAYNIAFLTSLVPVNIARSTITNLGVFGRRTGMVTLDDCYINTQNGQECFSACDTIFVSGSSTIINGGNFGRESHGMILTGANVSNLGAQAEFCVGMNWNKAFDDATKGTLELDGTTYFYNQGRLGAGDGVFNLKNATLINDGGQVGLGMSEFNVLGGSFTNDGECARGCHAVNLTGGSVFNSGAFASTSSTITISGTHYFYNDTLGTLGWNSFPYLIAEGGQINNLGQIGPCAIQLDGGGIVNDGDIYAGQTIYAISSGFSGPSGFEPGDAYNVGGVYTYGTTTAKTARASFFSTGTLTGSGQMFLTGFNTINMPIEQGTITVGYLFSPSGNGASELVFNSTLDADMVVTGSGSVFATGTVIGDLYLQPSSYLSPGGLYDPSDELNLNGNLYAEGGSEIDIDFDASGTDRISITSGNLFIENGAVLRLTAKQPYQAPLGLVLISTSPTISEDEFTLGNVIGKFTVVGSQPLVELNVGYSPNAVFLGANYNSFTILASNANQASIGAALDKLDNNTNACLQDKINQMHLMTLDPLLMIFDSLDPSEFKGQQLTMEELTFALNDSLNQELYKLAPKFRTFVGGAYRYFNQNSYYQYHGFHANTGYEYLATTYGWRKWQILGAIGGMETSLRYKHTPSFSSSNSFFAALGLAGFFGKITFGFDALFGYNFIHTQRQINYFDLTARSQHGGFTQKYSAGFKYTHSSGKTNITPYDFINYQNSYENEFKEHGASCLGLAFQSKHRSVWRNELGLNLEMLTQKTVRPYVDLAYVYEYRPTGQNYTCRFVNTNQPFKIQGLDNAKNFLKYELGISSYNPIWNYRIKVNGMYSSKLQEYEALLSFNRKF